MISDYNYATFTIVTYGGAKHMDFDINDTKDMRPDDDDGFFFVELNNSGMTRVTIKCKMSF